MSVGKWRVTVEVIRSGQPRPYADTEHVACVTFEDTTWQQPDGPFQPSYRSELIVRDELVRLRTGFTSRTRAEVEMLESYLDYLRPVDGKTSDEVYQFGDPNLKVASIWEFRVVSPYTD